MTIPARRSIVSLLAVLACAGARGQQSPLDAPAAVAGRLVVVYRHSAVPADADRVLGTVRVRTHLAHLGMSVVEVPAGAEAAEAEALARHPEVLRVLRDRVVLGHAMVQLAPVAGLQRPGVTLVPAEPVIGAKPPLKIILEHAVPVDDVSYRSPAGWAVETAGGFGNGVAGGTTAGPWNVGLGAGVRIAVLDSGVDAQHPDMAPNLAVNLTEVDQTAMPSACDDGSPQDQQGHGTWAASLAAAAMGSGTGDTIGVAPQATLLNIKVLERMPGTGSTTLAQCEAGQASGLMSWVLAGMDDAVAQHANVISMSLGTMVDVSTGDGAGWKASFDQAAYAAEQAGVVIVAAAGNDGLDLSGGRYVELPAQARGVLAVTASTNPACAENLTAGATCAAGAVTRAYYSNHGGTAMNAIAAPGGSYPEGPDTGVSGWVRGACSSGLPNTSDGFPANGASFGCFGLGHVQYVQAIGTSASAPLVAGTAALLHAARPDLSAEQIVAMLRSTASKLPGMDEPELNLPAALGLR